MKIMEVEVFDLRGDGTIILKTRVKDVSDYIRYAWYVYYGNHLLFKSQYSNKPFMEYTITSLGTYRVKAFVLDKQTQKKAVEEVLITFDKKNFSSFVQDNGSEENMVPYGNTT